MLEHCQQSKPSEEKAIFIGIAARKVERRLPQNLERYRSCHQNIPDVDHSVCYLFNVKSCVCRKTFKKQLYISIIRRNLEEWPHNP
jgi:hypothetical protein